MKNPPPPSQRERTTTQTQISLGWKIPARRLVSLFYSAYGLESEEMFQTAINTAEAHEG